MTAADDVDDDAPLTTQQQMLMAYVDDELGADERRQFELELAQNPEIAIEVAGFRSLRDLTDSMLTMEPADHEIRRFWTKFYNRGEWRLGWLLVGFGALVLLVCGLWTLVVTDSIPLTVKIATISLVAGGALLLVNTVRMKIRTHQFDRYRGVLR